MSTDVPAASPWPLPISRSRATRSATAPPCRPGTLSQVLTGHYRRLIPKRPPSRPS